MENISLHQINFYKKQADIRAGTFLQKRDRLLQLKANRQAFADKYQRLFRLSASRKMVLVFIIFSHLSIGFYTGVLVFQLMQELLRGDLISGEGTLRLAAGLIILIFWGASLVVGHLIHLANIHPHPIEPRITSKVRYLIGSIVMAIIYLLLLFLLIDTGNKAFGNVVEHTSLIFYFGVLEVIFSYFAIQGLEILYVHFRRWQKDGRISRCERSIEFNSRLSETNYRYYRQALQQYNQRAEEPLEEDITGPVKAAIRYYEDRRA